MNEATALAPVNSTALLMPVMSITQAKARYNAFKEFVSECLSEGVDYGKIPGSDKDTLLKPGAEKLNALFGLRVKLTCTESIEDWTGANHSDEPFFYYKYVCAIYAGNNLIVESEASCNSWEVKYRYRQGERKCPRCGKATIIKGKADFGGGWLCFSKKGGCGAKFLDGDESIESQQVGRVSNPDVCDLVNTLQKMAQKRALIGSTLIATNASEFFTQDIEDFTPTDTGESTAPRNGNGQPKKGDSGKLQQPAGSPEEQAINAALLAHCIKQKGSKNNAGQAFFDAMYAKKPFAQRKAEAEKLGLIAASAQTVDAEVVEASDEPDGRVLLLADIEDLFSTLKNAFGKTDQQIAAEVARQCDGECEIERLDADTLATLKDGLTIWIQQLRKS